jgi:hypothetical protein
MIVLAIILAIVLVIFLIVIGIFLTENGGSIINDQLIAEYLDKLGNDFSIYHSEYSHRIDPKYSANVTKCIDKSPQIIRLIFPYNIGYIGVIPVWSKSKSRIDAMFATGVKTDWKRKKLGLE